jgi:ATP-dependent 26S proteasome regulatory subunit
VEIDRDGAHGAMLQSIDRNVIGYVRHADLLRETGRGTQHGVLLHGPPGTGKTLVTRWLARACPDCTVFLLMGKQYNFLRATCRLAREHTPSLIILDDVDLIAAHRRHNRRAPPLHELMDEMDGLGSASECIFLLTTNRPQAIETALAARPGRVDQAIYFPLPDLECRRRLFAQFGKGLDLSDVEIEPLLRRTEGASPAFLKELFRRVVLMAAERGERSQPLRVAPVDFERALRELVEFGGDLTRSFLGFPSANPPNAS